MYRVALALAAPAVALALSLFTASPARALEAYLFRGAGDFSFIGEGLTFSNGMDRLGDKLEAMGVPTTVYRWQAVDWAYRDIMKRRPEAVMIMGHSMGALSTITLANKLKGTGVRVAYIGTIDIPGPAAMAPANVEVAENFYHAFPVYGMLSGGPGFNGKLSNQYVFGQIHITMDKSQKVHSAALQFAGNAIAAGRTMQAYAPETGAGGDVLARVDNVLTGSSAVSTTRADLAAPTPAAELAGTGASFPIAAMVDPARIPVPTPAPARVATATGLPPIQ